MVSHQPESNVNRETIGSAAAVLACARAAERVQASAGVVESVV
jgi:hypothetical protein